MIYTDVNVRTALYRSGLAHPDAVPALLLVAAILGIDVHDNGQEIPGWPRGTHPPPPGGWPEQQRKLRRGE